MQYIKHYYVDAVNGQWVCTAAQKPKYKRHPLNEYPGLDVRVWMNDIEGIDCMLAQLPDDTFVADVTHASGKKAVKVLSEAEYNTVWTPQSEASTLYGEAEAAKLAGDTDTEEAKRTAADLKRSEALMAFRAL